MTIKTLRVCMAAIVYAKLTARTPSAIDDLDAALSEVRAELDEAAKEEAKYREAMKE